MLQRLFFFVAILGAECTAGPLGLRPAPRVGETQFTIVQTAQAADASDSAERLKRRDALRAALRTQGSGAPGQQAPQPRSPQDRAALRAQLREPLPAPKPVDAAAPVRTGP